MEIVNLQQIRPTDGHEGYEVLQRIGESENDYTNPVLGKSIDFYRSWLAQQDEWSRKENLPNGYVGQTCFWLVMNEQIVGLGKIRHALTAQSRIEGGNIGIAIDPIRRGKGLATLCLSKRKQMPKRLLLE